MATDEVSLKLNIGSGRVVVDGFLNIDLVQYLGSNGKQAVDLVMDIEKEVLPYGDDSVDEILIDNVLEHLEHLRFVLNECHRVLKSEGIMRGCVPVAGTRKDFKDPTHKRHFIRETFSYFTGVNAGNPALPSHPKYADYGFKPWHEVSLKEEDDMIWFELKPRK